MARKRYRNKTDVLQIVYDEQGVKREVVPDGTIIMEDSWAKRYHRVLEEVPTVPKDSGFSPAD
jgi:pyruvate/oxaloacetate carboxyltransferase